MGKSDKKEAKKVAGETQDINRTNLSQGATETSERLGNLTGRSDRERQQLNDIYTKFGGSSSANYLGNLSNEPGGGGGGGASGGGNRVPTKEDYVGVWEELMNKEGGFDPTRLGNVNTIAGKLRGAEGNYGVSKDASSSLMDFAKRGGITDDDRSSVNRDTLLDFEKTGGYSSGDLANIRSRANSSVPSFYQNLQEGMNRNRGVNNFGPGFDRAGFKLMRESAQQQGNTARDTELGISDAVRSGRLDASKFLSQQGLSLADLTSKNQLQGYGTAGNMDISRNQGIQDAIAKSAGLDLDTQGLINQSRLGAASGKSQDARARQAIGASSGAASAARADANKRWASQMEQQDRMFGASGLSDTYSRRPEELVFNQGLLRDYRNDLVKSGNADVNNRINIGYMPGTMDAIGKGIGLAGKIGGMAAGGLGGLWDTSQLQTGTGADYLKKSNGPF